MPFGQFLENGFKVFGEPCGSRRFCRLFSSTRRAGHGADDAFSFFECFPRVFVIRNLYDIFGCRCDVIWGSPKDIAPFFGGFKNYMSSIGKQPR